MPLSFWLSEKAGFVIRLAMGELFSCWGYTVALRGERPGLREEAEFSGLMGNFVRAAEEGLVDPVAVAEILQTHRELLDARAKLESRPRQA